VPLRCAALIAGRESEGRVTMAAVARQGEAGSGDPHDKSVESSAPSFPAQFDRLIQDVHPRDRGPYTLEEIAAGVAEVGGPTFTPGYYHHLRTGRRWNPTWELVVALARFFDVPLAWFAPEGGGRDDESPLIAASSSRQLRELVSKIQQIDHASDLAALNAVVDSFLRRDSAAGPADS
jgi:hypothetical protein